MSNEELAVLAQQGNREAIEGLWEQVKRLLYQLARRFYRRYGVECCAQRGVTMADLEQECFLVLLDAVKAYKENIFPPLGQTVRHVCRFLFAAARYQL